MDGLILFSHGSLLCGAGETLRAHATRLRARGDFAVVEVGYMNYSAPTFAEAVARCAASGVTRAFIMPYFLVPGKFVSVDLPRHLAAAREVRPEMAFVVAEPLGFHEGLADALLEMAASARPSPFWRENLRRAADFCQADPRCPLYHTPSCPAARVPLAPARKNAEAPPLIEDRKSKIENPESPVALLVMVHGSPRPAANTPMHQVVEKVRARGIYPIVEVGFMECNEPDIPTAIAACVAQGAARIVAVPYFLHTGHHVAADLPTLLEEAQARYPTVEFRLGDFVGRSPCVTGILAERAAQARCVGVGS